MYVLQDIMAKYRLNMSKQKPSKPKKYGSAKNKREHFLSRIKQKQMNRIARFP